MGGVGEIWMCCRKRIVCRRAEALEADMKGCSCSCCGGQVSEVLERKVWSTYG